MRNRNNRLRTLAAGAALVVSLMGISSSQALAAVWTPTGTTATGSTVGSSFYMELPAGVWISCQSSMTLTTSATGTVAYTQTNGVAFSSCNNGNLFRPTTVSSPNGWLITPNSTTSATIQILSGGLRIVRGSCTVTTGPGPVNVAASWSSVTRRLSVPVFATVPFTATGTLSDCGGQASGNLRIQLNPSTGWQFPALNIV